MHPAVPASGVYTALLTPRKPGSTDADAAALLDYLDCAVNAGVDGLVLFGATGEFIHFDPAERARAATLAIRRSRVPVLVNISHSTLTGTVALGEAALKIGAAGVLLMPPYFYRYNDGEIFAFYRHASEIFDRQLPIYLYNLPAFTNTLSFELIERLLTLPGVAGIKDSSGDPELASRLQALRRNRDFSWMAGSERLYPPSRLAGGDGTVSGISAALPELLVSLDRAILAGNEANMAVLRDRLDEFVTWVERLPPVVAIRETAAFRGWIRNEPALPHSPETQTSIANLHSWLASWLPEMLCQTRSR